MRLYNSMTRQVERFRPRAGQPVAIYVCGITPYDTTHLGHAFTYVVFDVLVRHLETVHGWATRYVQNLTDIDDDILRRAASTGRDWRALGLEWTNRFTTDMAHLGVRPPTAFPGATAFIDAIQRQAEALLAAGRAYVAGGSVFYRSGGDPGFGAIARLPYADMLAVANERGNVADDPNKDDPLDFVLWQGAVPGEPAWRSPWGPGRPGWHIECSTMATALLGSQIDIHGGGGDLLFPHHACCIAQAESAGSARPWVRFWMHTAMVRKDGEKMSKSLGNLVLARDLLSCCEPDQLRLYLLGNHYRTPWEWDPEAFERTGAAVRTLHAAMARESRTGDILDPSAYGPRFTEFMDDDLGTPRAVATLLALADDVLAAPGNTDVRVAQDLLRTLGGDVLGLWLRPYGQVPAEELARTAWPEPTTAPPDGVHPF